MRSKPETRNQKPETNNLAAGPLLVSGFWFLVFLPRNIGHLPWSKRLEKPPNRIDLELRIARLDHQEELIARGLVESPHVEDGVIRHRQAVQGEHAEDGEEGGHEDRALERDRDPSRPRVKRLAADVERIADHVRVPAHEEAADAADDPAEEHEQRHARVVHP